MDIFLTQDGKSLGPYSAEELREKLAKGEVDLDESAWSAEAGDWIRLGAVLELAESAAKPPEPSPGVTLKPAKSMLGKLPDSASEATSASSDKAGTPPKPTSATAAESDSEKLAESADEDSNNKEEAPQRMGSSKLRSPAALAAEREEASGKKKKQKSKTKEESKGAPAPVRAIATAAQKDQQAKKSKVRQGTNPLSFLRWLGVVAFAAFMFTLFMPWITSKVGDTRSHLTAVDVLKAKPSEVAIPGSNQLPKFFRPAKVALLLSGLGVLLALLLSVVGAINPEGDTSGVGIVLLVAVIGGLVTFGVLQGHFLEKELNTKLQEAAQNGGFSIEGGGDISLDLKGGFYLAIAAVGLMIAFLAVPGQINGTLAPAMVPCLVLAVLALCVGGFAFTRFGEGAGGAVTGALTEMKSLSGQLGGAAKNPAEAPPAPPASDVSPAEDGGETPQPPDSATSPF